MTSAREQFARWAATADAEIDLPEAALWIAAEEYPDLDVPRYLARFDALAGAAAPEVDAGADLSERVSALNRFLFAEQRFHGDTADYYDPRNSYLNEVLDRRRGIPITLSLVYMAVGARLGLEVRGISFPGHFLVKCVGNEEIVVDAFAGVTLSRAECQQRLEVSAGRPLPLRPEVHLRAATAREVLIRMLSNLKQIFARTRDLTRTLACCDRLLLLAPDTPSELHDRARVFAALECFAAAAADVDRFLALAPDDPRAAEARPWLTQLRDRIEKLH